MTYFEFDYLVFLLPVLLIVYSILPKKLRPIELLIASYVFFCFTSGRLVVYMVISTFTLHYFGLWLDNLQNERKKTLADLPREEKKLTKKRYDRKQNEVVVFALLVHLGLLLVIKYSSFFATNINVLLENFNMRVTIPKFAAPLGISFYTLQAVSYIIDVRRGQVKADHNVFHLALYLVFFPQIVEGPIARYNETGAKLFEGKNLEFKNLSNGFIRILYGILKKVLIADRLEPFVKAVFEGYDTYDGGMLALGALAYTCQLYMDFSGTMDLVIGSGELFGITLPENFRQPFFSKNISDFWSRWHITLGTWFKDYIFYPVSLSKGMKKLSAFGRKHFSAQVGALMSGSIALFLVWLANGLWHGAAWTYIFFGMYHFVLIVLGNIFEPLIKKIFEKAKIDRNGRVFSPLRILKTFFFIVIGELFFRAETLDSGFAMLKGIFTNFTLNGILEGQIFKTGIDLYDVIIVLVVTAFVFFISVLKEKNIQIREEFGKLNIVIRWIALLILIVIIVIFGAYGTGYAAVEPMYSNF